MVRSYNQEIDNVVIIMKFHLTVLIALSSLLLLNISETSSYETREILPQTGFWNYLPVFGIWARIVHYLAVDSNGLGGQVKTLDQHFKNKYTAEKYVDMVNRVVNKLPKIIIAFRVLKIKENLRDVRDPKTGRTLGDAFDIIRDLESDENVVNEIASRLNLVSPDSISMIDFDLKTALKNIILKKPLIIADVLKNPEVVNFIVRSVLQYLASDQVIDGIESLQSLISVVEFTHPDMFREGRNSLFDLTDLKSGKSFIKTLEILLDIIEHPEFPVKLAELLNKETMTYLHEKTQDVVSKVIKQSSRKQIEPQMTAKQFVNILNSLNIKLDEQTAENILQASRNNELGVRAHQFLTELSQKEDLTPAKVAQFIEEKGVTVDEKSVQDAISTITSVPPNMLSEILRGVGLNMPEAQITEMSRIVSELKKTYERSHPSANTGQPIVREGASTQHFEIISNQNDSVESENREKTLSV